MTLTAQPYERKPKEWHWIAHGHGGAARFGAARTFKTRGKAIADILDVTASVRRNGINIRLADG